ncbi:hypothetical protein OEV98_08315 [Caldibacillus lycopersici]|uniref:Uncharacterized protein n=1 Tax=Perspicuibacillus lycopersici TaxID=1325689 RepID=A0AAE3ISA9_9BACI|nr:hypothetical protein [Perspicuibacillus lycopersici]MCU9613561.1 hypothetical protein [Perspicuibacillus lycopersici]
MNDKLVDINKLLDETASLSSDTNDTCTERIDIDALLDQYTMEKR